MHNYEYITSKYEYDYGMKELYKIQWQKYAKIINNFHYLSAQIADVW